MADVKQKALLEEFKFLSCLIKKHEAASNDAKINLSSVPKNCTNLIPVPQKLNKEHSSLPQYKLVKNPKQPLPSFSQKYSFHKSNQLNTTNSNKRTVLNNQFKSEMKSEKINSHSQLIEEIQSLTQLLKKKTSENKLSNPDPRRENKVQNKLMSFKCPNATKNLTTYNKYKSVKEDAFSKSKSVNGVLPKVVNANVSLYNNNNVKQSIRCYSRIIPCKNTSSLTKSNPINQNKYRYKKVDSTTVNSKLSDTPLNNSEKKEQAKAVSEKKPILEPCLRKVIYSDSKNVKKSPCNSSVFSLTSISPTKLSLLKSNLIKEPVSLSNKLCKKSFAAKVKPPSQINLKTPRIIKPTKVSKLKISSTRYTKINKHLTTPSKGTAFENAFTPKINKKISRNVNTKYTVINKTHGPHLNKKSFSLNNLKCDKTSPVALDESESFFQELNDTAIDKLEKDLLAMSTALTTTPTPRRISTKNNKINHFPAKVNLKLSAKKMSLKKPKERISKYKFVNASSPQNYFARKQPLNTVKQGVKKINRSKYSLVNKNIQPQRVSTPVRLGKSILVKRLFKSKNTIINKNASPTNYSAKMIKSKYLTLTKRKFPCWQKQAAYTKVPSQHQKLKGYYLRAVHNRYQKAAFSRYLKRTSRKFSSYNCHTSRSRFVMNSNKSKLKKKLKNGYICSPVLFVRGVRYSQNSSGKTLKKLPTKGQTSKTVKRIVIGGKAIVKTPDNLLRTPSNLASRVLHRSINRILIASTKKNLTKVNTYCMFYNRFGRCNKGVKCTYIHDPSKIAVCTRFLRGTCKVDGCPFSHEIAPGKMAICSFFLLGVCEKENCPYRHEKLLPDAQLCKAFVQGYCPSGKECKKAHILICPKYIQGECDKGSSCAFPHPPKKVKKTVQKEEEDEGKKPDDVLLEKVARYFQQTDDTSVSENKSNEITVANRCVPKYREKLKEQPAFIPLFDNSVSSSS